MIENMLCMIGTTELLLIGGAILLLFGGKKIPELMKSMGQGVKSFKEGMKEGVPDDVNKPNQEANLLNESEMNSSERNE